MVSVPRLTGSPLRMHRSARTTRWSGRKKLDAAWLRLPALRATTSPRMLTTGEPEEPPEVLDAAWM